MKLLERERVEQVVNQVIQRLMGVTKELEANDRPIAGLGLTSLDGIDFACEVQKLLPCEIPKNLNPFVDDAHHKERTVSQIVDLVLSVSGLKAAA